MTAKSYKPHMFVGALALVSGLIMRFEGERLHAYFDPPHIPTICYGHTSGVKITDTATDAECQEYLYADMQQAIKAYDRIVKVKASEEVRAAMLDFIYNVGEGRFATSTMLRKLNASDIKGACNELKDWICAYVKAGTGERDPAKACFTQRHDMAVIPGLVTRREAEKELCLKGVK